MTGCWTDHDPSLSRAKPPPDLASLGWVTELLPDRRMGMRRYLLAAIWPAGLAAITSATLIAARRAPVSPSVDPPDPGEASWAKDLIRLGVISGAGGVLSYHVMALIGPPV